MASPPDNMTNTTTGDTESDATQHTHTHMHILTETLSPITNTNTHTHHYAMASDQPYTDAAHATHAHSRKSVIYNHVANLLKRISAHAHTHVHSYTAPSPSQVRTVAANTLNTLAHVRSPLTRRTRTPQYHADENIAQFVAHLRSEVHTQLHDTRTLAHAQLVERRMAVASDIAQRIETYTERYTHAHTHLRTPTYTSTHMRRDVVKCIHTHMYESLMRLVEDSAHDRALQRRIDFLCDMVSCVELGAVEGLDSHHSSLFCDAVQALRSIHTHRNPSDKLTCTVRVVSTLTQAWNSLQSRAQTIGADDLLPCVITCVVRSNPAWLHSDLKYMETFGGVESYSGESAYALAQLSSAKTFVSQIDGSNLIDCDVSEFIRRVVHSEENGKVWEHIYDLHDGLATSQHPLHTTTANDTGPDLSSAASYGGGGGGGEGGGVGEGGEISALTAVDYHAEWCRLQAGYRSSSSSSSSGSSSGTDSEGSGDESDGDSDSEGCETDDGDTTREAHCGNAATRTQRTVEGKDEDGEEAEGSTGDVDDVAAFISALISELRGMFPGVSEVRVRECVNTHVQRAHVSDDNTYISDLTTHIVEDLLTNTNTDIAAGSLLLSFDDITVEEESLSQRHQVQGAKNPFDDLDFASPPSTSVTHAPAPAPRPPTVVSAPPPTSSHSQHQRRAPPPLPSPYADATRPRPYGDVVAQPRHYSLDQEEQQYDYSERQVEVAEVEPVGAFEYDEGSPVALEEEVHRAVPGGMERGVEQQHQEEGGEDAAGQLEVPAALYDMFPGVEREYAASVFIANNGSIDRTITSLLEADGF